MKSERKILIAFILNGVFALFELFAGVLTGSVAILSDAVHDAGDAVSIGLSYFLQKKSRKKADSIYTYGYGRYSVLGAALTNAFLMTGSVAVMYKSLIKIISPSELNAYGMLIFALVGFAVNLIAVFVTRGGDSLNLRAVSLHMLEDVLGWAAVLIGSAVIKLTGFYIIDPIISLFVSLFIFVHAAESFKKIIDLFLEKVPDGIDAEKIKKHLLEIEGVKEIHHIHLRSLEGENNLMSFHAVIDSEDVPSVKKAVKARLREWGIAHSVIETETVGEDCGEKECVIEGEAAHSHCGHHH